jgi:hypothetical protein
MRGARRHGRALRRIEVAYRRCRDACVARGVKRRIARKGVESTMKLGKHRWIVERTIAWLARYRRLTIRDERLVGVHRGFLNRPARSAAVTASCGCEMPSKWRWPCSED